MAFPPAQLGLGHTSEPHDDYYHSLPQTHQDSPSSCGKVDVRGRRPSLIPGSPDPNSSPTCEATITKPIPQAETVQSSLNEIGDAIAANHELLSSLEEALCGVLALERDEMCSSAREPSEEKAGSQMRSPVLEHTRTLLSSARRCNQRLLVLIARLEV